MALRKIAQIGHPVLRVLARPLSREELLTEAGQSLIDDLIATMRDADGAGLAAPQMYESVRVCVIEVGQNARYPYKPKIPLTVLVNPVLTPLDARTFPTTKAACQCPTCAGASTGFAKSACKPGIGLATNSTLSRAAFRRAPIQHEVDHLDATIFVDRSKTPALCAPGKSSSASTAKPSSKKSRPSSPSSVP